MDFESIEKGAKLSRDEFARRTPDLRVGLLNAQFDLRGANFAVLLLVMGDDRHACEVLTDRLHEWLDPRGLDTEAFLSKREEEEQQPLFWRYWRALPPHGRIGIHLGGWAYHALAERLGSKGSKKRFTRRCDHARAFERELTSSGMLLIKVWLHSPAKVLERRLQRAEKNTHGWRARRQDRAIFEQHDKIVKHGAELVGATDSPEAPWLVVDASDKRHREVAVFEHLRDRLTARLAAPAPSAPAPALEPVGADRGSPLGQLDLGAAVNSAEYESELPRLQRRLSDLSREARERGVCTVLAFEGMDAAGKGGAIRRLVRAMSAGLYRVTPIAAPTELERSFPYLWRFWRRLPRAGEIAIFDRSWYGRLLVERVEGFATEAEWKRAFGEIRDFEAQLTEHGTVVAKFWLHIDADEQLRRFEARERTPYKKYKITDEDYRNRDRWDEYVAAIDEMLIRTDTPNAHWHTIAANDKRHARLEVLRAVCRALEAAL